MSGSLRNFNVSWWRWAVIPVLAFLSLSAWAFASPVGASPDDDYHLVSTWCGLGEREGLCQSTGDPATREVPTSLISAAHCYAFREDESAGCQRLAEQSGGVGTTDRGNFNGNYPGLFYGVMGVFASENVEASVIAMRVTNAFLFVALITMLSFTLRSELSRAMLGAWLVSIVPLGMFLIPSINPSSWALLSAGTLWVALVGYFSAQGRRKISLGALAVFAGIIGIGSRPDATIWTAIGVLIALCISAEPTRQFAKSSTLPLAIMAIAAAVTLSGNVSGLAGGDLGSGAAAIDGGSITALVLGNVLNVPQLWLGVFSGSLGWLDTAMPAVVGVGGFFVFAAVLAIGIRVMSRAKALAMTGVFFVLWAFPTYVLVQSRAFVGSQVQPRYIMPLMIMLVGVALVNSAARTVVFSAAQRLVFAIVIISANSVALHLNIRRYVTGFDGMSLNLDAGSEWWWSVAPPASLTWIVGSLAFGAVIILLAQLDSTSQPEGLDDAVLSPTSIKA
jgi:hypothetical protein